MAPSALRLGRSYDFLANFVFTACVLIEEADGSARIKQRQFGTFKRDCRELAVGLCPDEVVMESAGIYWKSPFGLARSSRHSGERKVVNARHVKNVPNRNIKRGEHYRNSATDYEALSKSKKFPFFEKG